MEWKISNQSAFVSVLTMMSLLLSLFYPLFSAVEPAVASLELPVILEGNGSGMGVTGYGKNVSFAGDFNNDGFEDLVISDPDNESVYMFFGPRQGNLTPENCSVRFLSNNTDWFGGAILAPGDLDGDGFDDLVIGEPGNSTYRGTVYVFFGMAYVNGSVVYETQANLTLEGYNAYEYFGGSLGSGDLNNDGRPDILVSAVGNSSLKPNGGAIYSYFGGAVMDNISDWKVVGNYTNETLGYSIVSFDVNGDGYDDVITGEPHNSSCNGSIRVFYYNPAWPDTNSSMANHTFNGTGGSFFGNSLACLDLDTDGNADLLVGAPYNNSKTGAVYLFLDIRAHGNVSLNLGDKADTTFLGESPGDLFGWSLSFAGDFNADSCAYDIAVGAPGNNSTSSTILSDSGTLYVFCPTALTPGVVYANSADYILKGNFTGEMIGLSVDSGSSITTSGQSAIIVSGDDRVIYTEYSPLLGIPDHVVLSMGDNTTSVDDFLNVTIQLADAFGFNCSGQATVNISVSSGRINSTNMSVATSAYNYVNGTVDTCAYLHLNNTNITQVWVNITYTNLTESLANVNTTGSFYAGAPATMEIVNNASSAAAGNKTSFVIQFRDKFGHLTKTDTTTTIYLGGNSTTQRFYDSLGGVPVDNVTIGAGMVNITLYYNNTAIGYFQYNVSVAGLPNASAVITITGAEAYKVVMVSGPVNTTAGSRSSDFTLELQDYYGNPTTLGSDVTITLSSNQASYTFYDNLMVVHNQTTIQAGSTQTTCSYYSEIAGGCTLVFNPDSGLLGDNTPFVVNPAAADHITVDGPSSMTAGSDVGPFTITLVDTYGNPVNAVSDITVSLSSNSSAYRFAMVSGGATVTFVTISSGASSTVFYYNSTRAGYWNITCNATSDGLGLVSHDIAVNPAAAAVLEIFNFASQITAGTAGSFNVRALDAYGNIVTVSSSLTINLITNCTGTCEFRSSPTGSSITTIFIPSGQQSTIFYLYAETVQICNVTVQSAGLTSDTVLTEIVPAASAYLSINALNPNSTAGTWGMHLRVSFFDQFGNPASGQGIPVSLSSDSAGSWNYSYLGTIVNTVTLSSDEQYFDVLYNDTVAGYVTLGVSASGLGASQVVVEILPASPYNYTLSAPNQLIAGEESVFTIVVMDRFSNTCTQDYSSVFNISLDNAETMDGHTVFDVTVSAGTVDVHFVSSIATEANITIESSLGNRESHIPVLPAMTQRLQLSVEDAEPQVGIGLNVTVRAYDQFDNFVYLDSTTTVTLHLSRDGGNESVTMSLNLINGTNITTLPAMTVSGNYTLNGNSSPTAQVSSLSVCYHPGPMDHASVKQISTTATVSSGVDVLFTLQDIYNNTASEDNTTRFTIKVTGQAVFTVVDGNPIIPFGSYTMTSERGLVTAHLTDTVAEAVNIYVGDLPGDTFILQVTFDDDVGPSVSDIQIDKNPTFGAIAVVVTATISDIGYGGSQIQGAELFVDNVTAYGTGIAMLPMDGVANSALEEYGKQINISDLPNGEHTIYVIGYDINSNHGPAGEIILNVTDGRPPTPVKNLSADGMKLPATLSNTHPVFSWSKSIDPDGMEVVYILSIGTMYGASDVLSPVQVIGLVYEMSISMDYGVYYITVRAYDGTMYSENTTGELTISPPGNRAPTPPTKIKPLSVSDTRRPNITWSGATDSDGDTLSYWLQIGTELNIGDILPWTYVGAVEYYQLDFDLADGTYYIQIKAYDGKMNSSTFQSMLDVHLTNLPPTSPLHVYADDEELLEGSTTTIDSTAPVISWSASSDPNGDPITYLIMIGTSSGDNLLDWTAVGNTTTIDLASVGVSLENGQRYYISIIAKDMELQSEEARREIYVSTGHGEKIISLSLDNTELKAHPGDKIELHITVRNPLNRTLAVALSVNSPAELGAVYTFDRQFNLDASGERTVTVVITIPEDAKPENYRVVFSASGNGVGTSQMPVTLTIEKRTGGASTGLSVEQYYLPGAFIVGLILLVLVIILVVIRKRGSAEDSDVSLEDIESNLDDFFSDEDEYMDESESVEEDTIDKPDDEMLSEKEIEDDTVPSEDISQSNSPPEGSSDVPDDSEMLTDEELEQKILMELQELSDTEDDSPNGDDEGYTDIDSDILSQEENEG